MLFIVTDPRKWQYQPSFPITYVNVHAFSLHCYSEAGKNWKIVPLGFEDIIEKSLRSQIQTQRKLFVHGKALLLTLLGSTFYNLNANARKSRVLLLLLLLLFVTQLCLTICDPMDYEHPCFVPDIRGNSFSFSSLQMMFTMGLSYTVVVVVQPLSCI